MPSTTTSITDFDTAFARLVGHEGGYVNHPADPGGETNFGITKRDFTQLDIKALTLEQARAIYLDRYWTSCRADDLPAALRFQLFDACVNSGRSNAVRWLQRAAGVADDGIFGPVTLKAAWAGDARVLAARFNGSRLQFYMALSTWPSFGRGWARRVADNLRLIGGADDLNERIQSIASQLQAQTGNPAAWARNGLWWARSAAQALKEVA